MWWDNYQPARTAPQPQKKGGLLRGLAGAINDTVITPVMRGADFLGKSQENLFAGRHNKLDVGQFAKDTVATGLNFSPLAAAKGLGVGARIAQGAKIGAGAGAVQGATNAIGSNNPEDYLTGALQGGLTGGATGGVLGGVSGVASKIIGNKVPTTAIAEKSTATPTSLLNKVKKAVNTQGQQMEARSGGYGTGAKMSGSKDLGFGSSADIGKTIQSEGISAGNPLGMQRSAEEKLGNYGSQIDQALTTSNRELSSSEKKAISDQIKQSVENAGVDDTIRNHALEIAKNFDTQVKDVKDLVKFRRELDQNNISYISNPDAATAAKQQAATGARGAISEATNDVVPDLKDLNSRYHNLSTANEYLIKGGRDINNASGGIIGRVANSGPVQSSESKVGRVLQHLTGNMPIESVPGEVSLGDRASAATANGLKNVVGGVTQNAYRSRVPGAFSADVSNPNAPEVPVDTSEGLDGSGELGDASGGIPGNIPDESQSMYGKANLMSDIQRDPKNIDKYLALYKQLNPAGSGAKPLSAEASKQLGNAQSGLGALESLASQYNQDPGVVNKNAVAGVGGNLGRGIAGTQGYETARNEVIDVLARLRTGAAISKSEEDRYKSQLPTAFDSPETVAQKLAMYQRLFEGLIQRSQSGSPDLESAGASLQ